MCRKGLKFKWYSETWAMTAEDLIKLGRMMVRRMCGMVASAAVISFGLHWALNVSRTRSGEQVEMVWVC